MSRILTMEPKELASMIRNPSLKAGTDYLVVDVRDDDFVGGNIPGALHLPSHQLFGDPIVAQTQLPVFHLIPKLIFHCYLSAERGPRAARYFALHLDGPQIYVLQGGFRQWQATFKNDKDLLDNYNQKMWQENGWE